MATLHVEVDRIQDGQPIVKNILVSYTDHGLDTLPVLHIEDTWQPKKKAYKNKHDYTVEEFVCGGADFRGRGFRLIRVDEPDKVYDVFIADNGRDSHCDCPAGSYGNPCKHRNAIESLIELAQLPNPHDYDYGDDNTPVGYEYVF